MGFETSNSSPEKIDKWNITKEKLKEEKNFSQSLEEVKVIINSIKQSSYTSREEANKNIFLQLEQIRTIFAKIGIHTSPVTEKDVQPENNPGWFLQELNNKLLERGYFILAMVNTTTNSQGKAQHTNTLSLYKVESSMKKELTPYIPQGFSFQNFGGEKNQNLWEIPVYIIWDVQTKRNGITEDGAIWWVYFQGKIFAFRQEAERMFPGKDINKIINSQIIPNEMAHAFGESVGMKIEWQEVVSDIFSMNQLYGVELKDFILERFRAARTMNQYALTPLVIKEALKKIDYDKTGNGNLILEKIKADENTRNKFIEACVSTAKEYYKK